MNVDKDVVEFIGYSSDCRVEGLLELDEPRLADLLNHRRSYVLRDVVVTSHEDGHIVQLDELEVKRDELTAVVASGPRGDPGRRVPTISTGRKMQVGPYVADGHVHYSRPKGPKLGLRRQPAMIAMTNAWLAYDFCSRPIAERYPTLLVNRRLAAPVEQRPAA